MSTPLSRAPRHDKATPEDLAGVPVCLEEDQSTIRIRESQAVRAAGGPAVTTCSAQVSAKGKPITKRPPTVDELAGIPVSVDEGEDPAGRSGKPN